MKHDLSILWYSQQSLRSIVMAQIYDLFDDQWLVWVKHKDDYLDTMLS